MNNPRTTSRSNLTTNALSQQSRPVGDRINTGGANNIHAIRTKRDWWRVYAVHPITNKERHIATIKGRNYVKGLTAKGLMKYGKAVSLFPEEIELMKATGADVVKIERGDTGTTHTIGLQRFETHAELSNPGGYGKQWVCDLFHFQTTDKKSRSTSLNYPLAESEGYQRPQAQQLPMFDAGIRRDKSGQYWG